MENIIGIHEMKIQDLDLIAEILETNFDNEVSIS